MELRTKGTPVLQKTLNAIDKGYRIIILEGGTGSSKTYSLCQTLLILCAQTENQVFSIARKTMPALKATAMRTFFNILEGANLYNPQSHNKSDNTYTFRNNLIEFFSVDEPLRVRSRRRQYLWLNEANEFTLEDWRQLSLRTEKIIFLDFNPSDPYSWIYDEVATRPDCIIIHSTYKDNPFLPPEIIKEIEHYIEVDDNYWRVYGLGLRGASQSLVYPNWEYYSEEPEFEAVIYGLDFGYNSPSALVQVGIRDEGWYVEELLYEKYLTNQDLIAKLLAMNLSRNSEIYPDSAEPNRIEELKRDGLYVIPAEKDIKKGIDTVKSRKLYIKNNSINLAQEIRHYNWKEKNGQVLDEPVKLNDHLLDAMRYAIYSHMKQSHKKGKVMIYG